ncbi:hypothetical protein PV327_004159 [Microctonus hyperodae]|uniref:Uncharacterized protein n=1 Tax=Microctonus hyperodae TaxID=165561 RepID=A0AA39FBT5_MICHY|nr:hypothetical protein PV327_004159 [Microctonus hyperodae]
MGKKSRGGSQINLRDEDPDLPLLNDNTNSGIVPISAVERMRRRVTALVRDLNPLEIITILGVRSLSFRGSSDTLNNRLVRYELRREYGDGAAEWDPRVDEKNSTPRTWSGWQAEQAIDELIKEVRSFRLDTSRDVINATANNPGLNRRQEVNARTENYGNELKLLNRFELGPTLRVQTIANDNNFVYNIYGNNSANQGYYNNNTNPVNYYGNNSANEGYYNNNSTNLGYYYGNNRKYNTNQGYNNNDNRGYNEDRNYNPGNYSNAGNQTTENRNQGNWHRGQ